MTASSKPRSIYSRFIPREEVGHVTPVQFSSVDGGGFAALSFGKTSAKVDKKAQAELALQQERERQQQQELQEQQHYAELEQARHEAYDLGSEHGLAEGLEKGTEQGKAQATQEWQQRMDDYVQGQAKEAATRLDAVVRELGADLQAMQGYLAQQVLELATDIARQVVRQELHINPKALVPVVHEALEMLITDGRPATVRLNPQDHAVVAEALRTELADGTVQWVSDAAVAPGGCMVELAGTVIDGHLEKRWQRAIAPLGLDLPWQVQETTPAPTPAPAATPAPDAAAALMPQASTPVEGDGDVA